MNEGLWTFNAHKVVELLAKGEISSREVVQQAIDRIEETDGKVNALPVRCFKRALKIADKIDCQKEKANKKSLLGLPIAVKDYNDVAGVKTTYGSNIFRNNIPLKSDATVAKLELNGANPIAKSNVPEWAGGHTFNPIYGTTRNPFNLEKSAGGSSGGSAAALASGQVWLATGNDLGGSLRTPAGFNGIVGLRPSVGVVPRGQRLQPFDTLWVEGPMARSVRDVALMLDAGAGHAATDPLSFDHSCQSFVAALDNFDLPKNVACSLDLGIVPVSCEIKSVVSKAFRALESMGIKTVTKIPNFTGVLEGFHVLRGVLLASMMDDLLKANRSEILPDIVKNIEVGHQVSNAEIIQAEKIRKSIVMSMAEFFEETDFLVCPTTSVAPFDVKKPFITEIDGQLCDTYIDWFAITFALTMTSCPVVSLPCGFTTDGLPVGMQIVGRPRREDELLAFAEALEGKLGNANQVPVIVNKSIKA